MLRKSACSGPGDRQPRSAARGGAVDGGESRPAPPAAAYTHHLSGGAIEVRSAGSAPADQINPAVRDAMLEDGIDISAEKPKILTPEAVQSSDVVITMGCGDTCPIYPGKRYEDWALDDPAGQGIAAVRPIRDDIKKRVEALIDDLLR